MDIIDQAAEREEQDRAIALASAHSHPPALPAIGACYNCEASVPPGVRFCDSECRDDYDKRKAAEVRSVGR